MKNYKLKSLAVTSAHGKMLRKSDGKVYPAEVFGGEKNAEKLVEAGYIVEHKAGNSDKDSKTYDQSKSLADGMGVKKVKAHLETLNSIEAIDAFIDPDDDRKGVTKAVAERKEEILDSTPPTLLGSSTLDSVVKINDEDVQLGDIVAKSHKDSGMTVEEWNGLSDEDRDAKLAETIKSMTIVKTESKELTEDTGKGSTDNEPDTEEK